jgi:PAS domain-containing protein
MIDDILATLPPTDISSDDVLYIVDRTLNIVYVNRGWCEFALSNNGKRVLEESWHRNLLASFSGSQKARWTAIYRALLSGRLPSHEEPFICPSPTERRTFRLRILPRVDSNGLVTHLLHHAVRTDRKLDAQAVLQRQLSALDAEPAVTVEAYRACVMARHIRPAHFRSAQHFQPLEEVGGDLLWQYDHADGRTDVVLADVTGHGVDAARLATKLVYLLDAIVVSEVGVAQIVSRLSRLLLQHLEASPMTSQQTMFATGLYLRLDPMTQLLTVCSFGHSGPIFSKAGRIMIDAGLPVGLMEESEPCPEVALELATHGKRFLIFTDGVTEQFDPSGDMFGEDGLEREFLRTIARPLPEMLEQICACVEAFRGPALVKDDQTLLALEYAA